MDQAQGPSPTGRRRMSLRDVAAVLELRLHDPWISPEMVAERSGRAAEQGLAAVLCRPDDVPIAAVALHESQVGIATVVDFQSRRERLPPPRVLTASTLQLAEFGATSLALVATRERLETGHGHAFPRALEAVTAAAHRMGATSRVLIDVADLSVDDQVTAAVLCRDAGASVIQAGVWDGARANFGLMSELREALGPEVKLK